MLGIDGDRAQRFPPLGPGRLASPVDASFLTADVALQRLERVAELVLRGLEDINLGGRLCSQPLDLSTLGRRVIAWCAAGRCDHEQLDRDDGETDEAPEPFDADRWSWSYPSASGPPGRQRQNGGDGSGRAP